MRGWISRQFAGRVFAVLVTALAVATPVSDTASARTAARVDLLKAFRVELRR